MLLFIPVWLLTSCGKSDEPTHNVFMQVSSIKINGSDLGSRLWTYDSYGRVVGYKALEAPLHINVDYDYISDDLVKIHTEEIVEGQNGANNILNIYEDELHLEKGRADYCEGKVTRYTWDSDPYEKKYRHDFIYTMDNHLNVLKVTEWEKLDDGWNDESPLVWENYYVWEEGNLVKVEDYSGRYAPYSLKTYKYNGVRGTQNILGIPMGDYQYYPLQLKEIFGPMSVSLISERCISDDNGISVTSYDYEVYDGRITAYSVTSENSTSTYTVQWTP